MMKLKTQYILFILFVGVTLFSCEQNEEVLNTNMKVFINSQIDPINESIIEVIISEDITVDKEQVEIVARITKEPYENVSIQFEAQPDLVEEYNLEHETSYLQMEASAIEFPNDNKITIKSQSLSSSEPLVIKFKNYPKEAGEYMLPIQIVKANGAGVSVSSNLATHYLIFKVVINNIAKDASSLLDEYVDRSSWSIKANGGGYGNVTNLLDGNKLSYFLKQNFITTINMNTNMIMDGIVLTPGAYGGKNFSYTPSYVAVYTSMDNVTWTYQYYTTFNNPTSFAELIKIKFINPVNARYLRLELKGGSSGYNCISEVNIVDMK
ncbi:DUF1735 domain-containing protein [Prolixibacteraceae bacterium]|nr:DUF1735 domain-containing protein [Prolixibacteraceae bacterium]